jgi:hypothetical protein
MRQDEEAISKNRKEGKKLNGLGMLKDNLKFMQDKHGVVKH